VKLSCIVAASSALSLLFGMGISVAVATPLDSSIIQNIDSPGSPGAIYCHQTGGVVERRIAVYGTNGSNPLTLSGIRQFCQYTAKDGSRIHLLLDTLYTTKPTLAALAYYAKQPLGGGCHGNPASCYCSQLGGSDQFGGTTGAGGGWVLKGAIDETLEACIFPDLSSIDSWGLAYHSNGIIRGRDLAKVLRYKNPF
jgi:putative hemolysin